MSTTHTPDIAEALSDAFAAQAFDDPTTYTSHANKRIDAKYFLKPVQDELLRLIADRLAIEGYRQTFTCVAGDAVGDPVRLSAASTVTKSLATTDANAKVWGFIAYKPTTTSCYVRHFYYKSGLSGLTANALVYLTDTGTYSATAGTVKRPVGVAISTTEALLVALPYTIAVRNLCDVVITSLTNGDTLQWDSASSTWVNAANATTDEKVKSDAAATAGYLNAAVDNSTIEVDETAHALRVKALGILDAHVNAAAAIAWSKISKIGAVPGDVGAAAAAHNHAGSDINSGTIDRARLPQPTLVSLSGDAVLAATDIHKIYANLGATLRTVTLPAPAAGLGPIEGYCGHTDGIRFVAPTGKRLRVNGDVTTADTGHVDSTTVGSNIRWYAIDDTNWVGFAAGSGWVVTAS